MRSFVNITMLIKTRRMGWVEHAARLGKEKEAHRIFIEKPYWEKALVRCRRRWENNIKIGTKEILYEVVEYVQLFHASKMVSSLQAS
jgi:hypothetical protein